MNEIFNQEFVLGDVSSGQGSEDDIPTVEVSSGDATPEVSGGDVTSGDVTEGDVTSGDVSRGDISVSGGDSAAFNDAFVCECSVAQPISLFKADIQELDTTDGLLLLILCVLLFIAFVERGCR